MSENYISINKLIERDFNMTCVYQLQSCKNDTHIQIINVGQFHTIPLVPILKFNFKDYLCEMISYVVSEDDIINKNNIKMIGFLIQNNKNIIVASLDLMFSPHIKLSNLNNINKIDGKFEIILSRSNNNTLVIKTLSEFPGREESVHLLTDTLLEDVI